MSNTTYHTFLSKARNPRQSSALQRISHGGQLGRIRRFHGATFLYSSIFAAAALIDSDLKSNRLKELDETIIQKEEEIKRLERSIEETTHKLLNSGYLDSRIEKQFVHTSAKHTETSFSIKRIRRDRDHSGYLDVLLKSKAETLQPKKIPQAEALQAHSSTNKTDYLESLLKHAPYTKCEPPAIIAFTAPGFTNIRHPPQSPYTSLPLPVKAWTPKKIVRVSVCVTRFVIRLSLAVQIWDKHPKDGTSLPMSLSPFSVLDEEQLRKQWSKIEYYLISLQQMDNHAYDTPNLKVPMPNYAMNDRSHINALNSRISKIWPTGRNIRINDTHLIEMCDILLTSPTHPDIHTLNIILNALNRGNRHDLIDSVVDLFSDGCFRPNEITCSEILRSYRHRRDSGKYLEFVSMINGFRSGLMVAKPKDRAMDIRDAIVPRQPGDSKLIQKMQPSPILYAEMIHGLLQFLGLKDTMKICHYLYIYGWGWSYACMHKLLLQCAIELDSKLGILIWKVAEELLSHGNPMPKALYARMLAYCSLSEQHNLYDSIFSQSLSNPSIPEEEMMSMVQDEKSLISSQLSFPD